MSITRPASETPTYFNLVRQYGQNVSTYRLYKDCGVKGRREMESAISRERILSALNKDLDRTPIHLEEELGDLLLLEGAEFEAAVRKGLFVIDMVDYNLFIEIAE